MMNKKTIAHSLKSYARMDQPKKKKKKPMKESWQSRLSEMIEDEFDAADVTAKLDAAEQRSRMDNDTVPFGMEDEEGNIVKVYVRADQADEFEDALANAMTGSMSDEMGAGFEEEDYDGMEGKEIAEVLFSLKDQFDIVDVEWPTIEGDEEEEQEMAADEADMDFEGGEEDMDMEGMDDMDMEDEDMDTEGMDDMDMEGDMDMEPEGGLESQLQQVVDMLKDEAEARKAEAEARKAEAEQKTAEANANSAMAKVSQEEKILDMEAAEEEEKKAKEETETLAKMARHAHKEKQKARMENEEQLEDEGRSMISKDELANMIQKYLSAAI